MKGLIVSVASLGLEKHCCTFAPACLHSYISPLPFDQLLGQLLPVTLCLAVLDRVSTATCSWARWTGLSGTRSPSCAATPPTPRPLRCAPFDCVLLHPCQVTCLKEGSY